jgi:hypothetical protein
MMEIKKILVVGIIYLFIGVAVAPSIQSNDVSSAQKKQIEITINAVGIPGLKSHTVKLTEEQLSKLECLITRVDQKLSQASTTQEAAAIFEDATEQLYPFGLFGALSLQQAKRVVTGRYHSNEESHLWNERINTIREKNSRTNDEYLNRFCFLFYRLTDGPDYALSLCLPPGSNFL